MGYFRGMKANPIVALLGGGQLGRMLIQAGLSYPARWWVMDPDPHAPCSNLAERFVCGSLSDHNAVVAFAEGADAVVIEIEHVSITALEALKRMGKRVLPNPSALEVIQDKGLQKTFLFDKGIPTSPFVLIEKQPSIHDNPFGFPVVHKLRKGGYDGRGVNVLSAPEALATTFSEPGILEQAVAIDKELSVLVARWPEGQEAVYDVVECVFREGANLVELLVAPARVESTVEAQAKELALRVARAFAIEGLLAVELFLDTEGRLWVNEVAPRPHNSGHHTIEANRSSQFDQLVRCALGLPPGSTEALGSGAMANLLGAEGHSGPAQLLGEENMLAMPGVYLHWYGKSETRPNRKMGHITVVSSTAEQSLSLAREALASMRVVALNP
jgi:5-(carboxyamino)imidazole ribonucleotide synthase